METLKNVGIGDLVQRLQSEDLRKRDTIVHSSMLKMVNGNIELKETPDSHDLNSLLENAGISLSKEPSKITLFTPIDSCHNQIGDKLGINRRYYERLQTEAVDMLDYNVSEWLKRTDSNYLLRTFMSPTGENNVLRAFLSDRFKPIDNFDVLMSAKDAIKKSGKNVRIESCDLTDNRMYVRFYDPETVKQAPDLLKNYRLAEQSGNFGIFAGFVLSNSETGHGSFMIYPRIIVEACSNGMIIESDKKVYERHLGMRNDLGDFNYSVETTQKAMELVTLQVRDIVTEFMSDNFVDELIANFTEKGSKRLQHPVDTVQNIALSFGFSDERKNELLSFFMDGGDTSAFGAVNALTYFAQTLNPEGRYSMEVEAVNILNNIDTYDKLAVDSRKQLFQN